jgi:hypothetical protein
MGPGCLPGPTRAAASRSVLRYRHGWRSGGRRKRSEAASRQALALEVGLAFAEIIRDNPVVHELWVTADTEEPGIYLWLYTDPMDIDAETSLLGPSMDLIEERFPSEYILVLPKHSANTIGNPRRPPRQDAVQIPLR